MPSKGTVWFVSQYEPAPGGNAWRPLRSLYAAQALIARGYEVVQWSATFSHQNRGFVAQPWEERNIAPGWTVRFVPNLAYEGNVGRTRLASEARFARNFYRRAQTEPLPVCMVIREPPASLGVVAIRFGRTHRVPVVSDVIDLWPEFFHRILPKSARGAGRVVFAPLYARRRRLWNRVNGLIAVSETYLTHAKRIAPVLKRLPTATVFSSIDVAFVRERMSRLSKTVEGRLGEKPADEVWLGYAGTLGIAYDVPVVLRAMHLLQERKVPVRFVVAGVGPFVPEVQAAADRRGSNVTFLGQLPPDDLYPMLARCDLGLLSYAADSPVAIPDKFYDYAATGLPPINSLQGEVRELIERWEMGVSYVPGDAESLATSIEDLVKDPARRMRMAERARAAAESWNAPLESERFADVVEAAIRGERL